MKYAIDHQRIFLAKQMYNRAWDAQVEAGFRREDLRNRYAAIFDTLSVLGIPFILTANSTWLLITTRWKRFTND